VQHLWKNHANADITLSLVGNSLGGLYSRFALSEIEWWSGENRGKSLIPRLFVTTATPHLGVSQHTYVRLPRSLEYPIARVMQTTGKDLFRFSSIIDEMTFGPKFLAPLLQFDQRIAYINVYGTDFQVPTPTAAFWAETDSLHHIVSDQDDRATTPCPNIVMKLETPQRPHEELLIGSSSSTRNGSESSYENSSQRLDELGWTKILVDVREHLPTVWTRRGDVQKDSWKKKQTWTARELLTTFGGMRQGLFTLAPLGHTVLVANAKDAVNRWITKGGKPIMDHLASTMIETIQTSSRHETSNTP
jgi:hypothetical protein